MNYHGTTIEHGNKAIALQTINKSVSTPKRDHWLGDGIYLYTINEQITKVAQKAAIFVCCTKIFLALITQMFLA